jgi:hypothetical protein
MSTITLTTNFAPRVAQVEHKASLRVGAGCAELTFHAKAQAFTGRASVRDAPAHRPCAGVQGCAMKNAQRQLVVTIPFLSCRLPTRQGDCRQGHTMDQSDGKLQCLVAITSSK